MQDQETVLRLSKLLYDRKAQDIVVLNVSHLTVLCDYMVIASGRTDNQVSSLADVADEMMAVNGLALRRSEGRHEGRWVILDYGHIIVHLFHRDLLLKKTAAANAAAVFLCVHALNERIRSRITSAS
jgi:ribosome-associated protein